jgi:hypothetical protein
MIEKGATVRVRSRIHSELEAQIGTVESLSDDTARVRFSGRTVDLKVADLEEVND